VRAVLTAGVLALPVALWNGGGSGNQPAGGTSQTGPSIEPTPGAPHGGCRQQTNSGSTTGHVFAEWFVQQVPARYSYRTESGWQNSYQEDCLDGARHDNIDVGARVVGKDGDLYLTTARSAPAQPVAKPCAGPQATATAGPTSGAGPTATAGPTPGAGTRSAGPGEPMVVYDRCETRKRPDGSTLTIEESHRTEPDPMRSRAVTWWRTDGSTVRLDVDNRHVLDDSAHNPQLVLTVEQMVALVTNPAVLVYLPPVR